MKRSGGRTGVAVAVMVAGVASTTMFGHRAWADGAGSPRLARRNFSMPTAVDNGWAALVPGTRLTLRGHANPGDGVVPRRVVFTVTDMTKIVDGIRTLVSWDRDYTDHELSEEELAFHAEDDDGAVWNVGEYPEEFDGGTFEGAPSTWLSGVAGALGGIYMPATPRPGTPAYLQWKAPAIEAVDRGKVVATDRQVCVPVACYDNVVVIDEWDPLRPEDGHQLKYHAPGVGLIKVEAVGGVERETLELVEVVHLSPTAMAEARDAVRRLDRRGYRVSPDVYALSPPVERLAA